MRTEKEQQFLEIIEENQQRIHKLCAMYTRTPEDQKDLVQEVILNIWKAFSSFKGEAAMSTWIYRIILNVCLKKRYAMPTKNKLISLDNLPFEAIQIEQNQQESFTELRQCIQQLEFSDRSIMLLFLEDLSYREIGETIGISENYVAVKIKRIKVKLGICLQKD